MKKIELESLIMVFGKEERKFRKRGKCVGWRGEEIEKREKVKAWLVVRCQATIGPCVTWRMVRLSPFSPHVRVHLFCAFEIWVTRQRSGL